MCQTRMASNYELRDTKYSVVLLVHIYAPSVVCLLESLFQVVSRNMFITAKVEKIPYGARRRRRGFYPLDHDFQLEVIWQTADNLQLQDASSFNQCVVSRPKKNNQKKSNQGQTYRS